MSMARILKPYVNFSFSGRASRREYVLVMSSGILLLLLSFGLFGPLGIVLACPYVFLFVNSAAIRRAHDMASKKISPFSSSNWSKLYYVESDAGENEYGQEPWDSKRNLRIAQNRRDMEQLLSLDGNADKRDKKLSDIIERLGTVDNDRLSLDLLNFLSDDRVAIRQKPQDITVGKICAYVLILQLLPPSYYWKREAFISPYRLGKDRKEHLRPFTFNNCFKFNLFDQTELRRFIEENQSLELYKQSQKVIQRLIDMETEIGFPDSDSEKAIAGQLKNLGNRCYSLNGEQA